MICDELKEIYNAAILEHTTPLEQQLFRLYTSYNLPYKKKHIVGNKTLIQLINNYYSKKGPSPDFIGGPISLNLYWNSTYNMTIYIFGELHSEYTDCSLLIDKKDDKKCSKDKILNPKTGRCVLRNGDIGKELVKTEKHGSKNQTEMKIAEFLKLQVANTPAFIDIYLELPVAYISNDKNLQYIKQPLLASDPLFDKLYKGRLYQIARSLRKCTIVSERKHKDCDLFRVHLVDVRKKNESNNLLSQFRILIHKEYDFNPNKNKIIREWIKNPNSIFTQTIKNLNHSLSGCIEFVQNQITSNFYVKKELRKSFLPEQIVRFLNTEISLMITKYWKDITYLCTSILLGKINDKDMVLYTNKLLDYTVIFNSYSMDAYTLSRIFKNFNVKHVDDIYQPKLPHNIIIYTGGAHSRVYCKFLQSIGSELKASTGKSYQENDNYWYKFNKGDAKNCIDMRDFPMPFFGKFPI